MLDFHIVMHPVSAFAILSRGELRCSSVSRVGPEVVARPCRTALDRHRMACFVIVVNDLERRRQEAKDGGEPVPE